MRRLTHILPAGGVGWAAQAAAQTAPPETQPLTIDRDGEDASPAVAPETGGGTWLWVVIILAIVLVVLALLKFLSGDRTRL